ncbi:hypothetical protein HUB92_06030 [Wolbachia endosymbiont of Wiebesia pumilae]|uniref:hypothetical protein n=1 Tax=Wolbachia endosymbiont of Wiebesia pumilae TaxID=2742717 RepID=UPI001AE3E1C2|nr:hypothetical protein [Wolbachia endosymbiont of Wiebesia pumilae]QTP62364.1 hypothetical protein HUB92_06030 [Wolbachia endosymbiont of Wiebesia pumilae]
MSLISLGYIFTYYFLLISSYSLSHFFSRQALRDTANESRYDGSWRYDGSR